MGVLFVLLAVAVVAASDSAVGKNVPGSYLSENFGVGWEERW